MSRQEQLDKLRQDLEKYHKDHLETQNRHHEEIEKMMIIQNEILLAREENELLEMERLTIQNQEFKGHVANVVIAGKSDQIERNFINAVLNTRTAGKEATSAVSKLVGNACLLGRGQPANTTIIDALKRAITVEVGSKLEELRTFASSVREQPETNNEKVPECREAAKNIDAAIIYVEDSLRDFRFSLEDEIIDESVDRYKQVVDACRILGEAVNSMPAVSQSNYATRQIASYTEKLQIRNSSSELPKMENDSRKRSERRDITIKEENTLSTAGQFNLSDLCKEIIGIGKSQFESLRAENKDGSEEIVLRHFMNIEKYVFRFQMINVLTNLGDDNNHLVDDNVSIIPIGLNDSKTPWHKANMKAFLERMREGLTLVDQNLEKSACDKLLLIKHLPQLAFSLLSLINSTKELISSGLRGLENFPNDSYAFKTFTWIFELWSSLKNESAESLFVRSVFQLHTQQTINKFEHLNLPF